MTLPNRKEPKTMFAPKAKTKTNNSSPKLIPNNSKNPSTYSTITSAKKHTPDNSPTTAFDAINPPSPHPTINSDYKCIQN